MEDLTTIPDRRLADWLFYDEVRYAEQLEVDAFAYIEDDEALQREVAERRDRREAVEAEIERRERLDIRVEDPDEPTFEERYAPFGIAWQEEQRDRQEGR